MPFSGHPGTPLLGRTHNLLRRSYLEAREIETSRE